MAATFDASGSSTHSREHYNEHQLRESYILSKEEINGIQIYTVDFESVKDEIVNGINLEPEDDPYYLGPSSSNINHVSFNFVESQSLPQTSYSETTICTDVHSSESQASEPECDCEDCKCDEHVRKEWNEEEDEGESVYSEDFDDQEDEAEEQPEYSEEQFPEYYPANDYEMIPANESQNETITAPVEVIDIEDDSDSEDQKIKNLDESPFEPEQFEEPSDDSIRRKSPRKSIKRTYHESSGSEHEQTETKANLSQLPSAQISLERPSLNKPSTSAIESPKPKRSRKAILGVSYSCDQCGKSFTRPFSLKVHKELHTGQKPYACDICGKSFAHKGYLATHALVHSGEKKYECQHCGNRFAYKNSYQQHLETHMKIRERKYACDQCGMTFANRGNWWKHCKNHAGIRFSCDQCDKTFAQKGNLDKHRQVNHWKMRPFKCDDCGKTFGQKCHLQTHKLTHSGEKNYVCEEPGCGRRFGREHHLKSHQSTVHLREKPFPCDICGKSFADRSNLRQHIRHHNGDKRYKCDATNCDKAFVLSSDLKRHRLVHSGEKPFTCEFCKQGFAFKSNMVQHIKKHH